MRPWRGECVPEVDWSITPAAAAASAAARSAAASRAPGGVTTPLGCRTLHHGARAPGGVTTPSGSRTLHHGALALSSTDAGRQTTCCLVAYRLPPQSCVAPVVAWPTAPSPAASSGTPKLESPHGHTVSRKHPHLTPEKILLGFFRKENGRKHHGCSISALFIGCEVSV